MKAIERRIQVFALPTGAPHRVRPTLRSFVFLCALVVPLVARADVKLPAMFSDHAVLQRDMALPVWGWADPGEEVTVSIAGQTHKTTADAKGKWRVKLEPLAVGEPLKLVVEGKNRLERNDILVGEVWVCSGQSNMEWSVANSSNPDLEIAAADFPNIRVITVTGEGSQTPVEDCDGKWAAVTPETIKDFTAVGYFFARDVFAARQIPIGIIHASWGGTPAEAWTGEAGLRQLPEFVASLAPGVQPYEVLAIEANGNQTLTEGTFIKP